MALVTCYDPQGVAHEKEPVDARECVAQCGYSMAVAAEPAQIDGSELPAPDTVRSKRGQKPKG